MSKLIRISGYLLSKEEDVSLESNEDFLKLSSWEGGFLNYDEMWQQLHLEESESFEIDGEDKENCDLSLLARHFNHISGDVKFDRPLPKVGEKYKHFKLGKIVKVIGISSHTETEEVSVVYEYDGKIWNRPLEMFMSKADREKYPNAVQEYRFELSGEEK